MNDRGAQAFGRRRGAARPALTAPVTDRSLEVGPHGGMGAGFSSAGYSTASEFAQRATAEG
jgi:hypothetical protein